MAQEAWMCLGEKPQRDEKVKIQAVSEVIGTVILVGIVMIGIVLVGLLLLSNPAPSDVPALDSIISNRSQTIYIYHKGGDPLFAGQYQILVDGLDQTANFAIMNPGSEPWSVGETLAATMPTMPRHVVFILNQSGGGGGGGGTIISESDLNPIVDVPLHPLNPPLVAWSSSPPFGNATITFQFTDSSTGGNITSYFWNFNDASTNTTQSPAHVFPTPTAEYDLYSINHSATDSGGTNWAATTWLNRSAWVTVYKNLTPTITFTQDRTSGPAGCLAVNFDATQYGAIKVDSWSWDFGDSGTSSSEDPSHAYTTQGIRTVTLTATNYTLGQTTVTKSNLIQVTLPWYSCSWLYRKNITLNKTAVPADLTNFPVLISYTDSDLSARALANGSDILFTKEDGTTKIPHEIETYSGGTLKAWVKVPSLTSGTNSTVFMYYGNPGASSQQNPTGVWDSNYKAVWHFKEDPSGTAPQMKDSTSNANQGTSGGSMTSGDQIPGVIDGSLEFDGSNDLIENASTTSLDNIFAGGGTFSAWVAVNGRGENNDGRIADKTSNGYNGWGFSTSRGWNFTFRKGFATTNGVWYTSVNTIIQNVYTYVVVTFNSNSAGNKPVIYINGTSKTVSNATIPAGSSTSDASYTIRIAQIAFEATRTFDGVIDEVRASNTIRSANWIMTEYRNQGNPACFHYNMTQEAWS